MSRPWTADEDALLRQQYPTTGPTALGRVMGRDRQVVFRRAKDLGLTRLMPEDRRVRTRRAIEARGDFIPTEEQIREECRKILSERTGGS